MKWIYTPGGPWTERERERWRDTEREWEAEGERVETTGEESGGSAYTNTHIHISNLCTRMRYSALHSIPLKTV